MSKRMKHIRALAEDFSAKIIGLCPYKRRLDDHTHLSRSLRLSTFLCANASRKTVQAPQSVLLGTGFREAQQSHSSVLPKEPSHSYKLKCP